MKMKMLLGTVLCSLIVNAYSQTISRNLDLSVSYNYVKASGFNTTKLTNLQNNDPAAAKSNKWYVGARLYFDYSLQKMNEIDFIEELQLVLKYDYQGRGSSLYIQTDSSSWTELNLPTSRNTNILNVNLMEYLTQIKSLGSINLKWTGWTGSEFKIYTAAIISKGTVKNEDPAIPTDPVIPSDPVNPTDPTSPTTPTNPTSWWKPTPGTTWDWQIYEKVDTKYNVQMYDVDLFDNSKEEIARIKHQTGAKVICYLSAGTMENWRSDAGNFPSSVVGKPLSDWPGERLLDVRKLSTLRTIMGARMDLAVDKGCDGVEPDNVDGYTHNTGFNISYDDQINYNKMLAEEAHKRNLSIGLKNDLNQIKDLEPFFDFAVNESCFTYDECWMLDPFVKNNKAVFRAEYEKNKERDICRESLEAHSTIIKNRLLDSFRIEC